MKVTPDEKEGTCGVVATSDCVLVFSLVDRGGTEVPAALGGVCNTEATCEGAR